MFLDNSMVASSTKGGKYMPKKSLPIGLIVICLTIVVVTALVRDSLCSVYVEDGSKVFEAVLAYEVRK